MNILALDTSSQAASCALLQDDRLLAEFFANIGLTHSQTAMPMVEALLSTTQMAPGDIDYFAVTVGPGSFTGLRIGLALIKGMALATEKPCVAVPTLATLAENIAEASGYIIPVMDARRNQIYTATFQSTGGTVSRLSNDTAISVEELGRQIVPLQGPVFLVGDGAELCMNQLEKSLPQLRIVPEHIRHQRASGAARIAARAIAEGKISTASALAPVYLRLPQAERERLERLQAEKHS